jgi:hypothetical protein
MSKEQQIQELQKRAQELNSDNDMNIKLKKAIETKIEKLKGGAVQK